MNTVTISYYSKYHKPEPEHTKLNTNVAVEKKELQAHTTTLELPHHSCHFPPW